MHLNEHILIWTLVQQHVLLDSRWDFKFICTCQPTQLTLQRGTCPQPRALRLWSQRESSRPGLQGCCGIESEKDTFQIILWSSFIDVGAYCQGAFYSFFNVKLYGQTLKFPGSTRNLKACRSLRALKPPRRSSILPTASVRAPITVLPCFLTGAEPGLVSDQWAKYVFVWGYTTSILQESRKKMILLQFTPSQADWINISTYEHTHIYIYIVCVWVCGEVLGNNELHKSYLPRASAPMSSALPATLPQKALTRDLSFAVRLILIGFLRIRRREPYKDMTEKALYINPQWAHPSAPPTVPWPYFPSAKFYQSVLFRGHLSVLWTWKIRR